MKLPSRVLALTLTGASAVTLAACSADTASEPTVTVHNCDADVSVHAPAQRVVSVEQGATETLLALGAADQIAGVGHTKDAYWAEHADEAKKLKVISDSIPTAEQIRDVDADLIVSPFDSVYTADQSGTREEYAKLGVGAWYTTMDCAPDDADAYEVLEEDYKQLGTLLGRAKEAQALIDRQREAVRNAQASGHGQKVAYLYSVYEGSPYVAGNFPITEDIGRITHTQNVFSDISEDWPAISWENFADKDPDVIILADLSGRGAPGDSSEDKIRMLKDNPATKNMKAVREEKFIVVPGVGLSPSARSIEPLQVIGEKLKGL